MHPSSLSRRRFLTLSGVAAAGGLLARGPLARACPALDPVAADSSEALASAVNAFAADLHPRLGAKGDNLFFSPFSIEAALGMTAAGARGETLDEMRKVLHLPADPHAAFGGLIARLNSAGLDKLRPYQLSVANAIWAQKGYPWHKEFVELTREHYGAGVVDVNFAESEAARKQINDWVEKETKDKIKELIPRGVISMLTRMVLANAIYFKANWRYQFDKKLTQDAPFTRADGTKPPVPLMHMNRDFAYGETTMFVRRGGEKVQILELPYAGEELSMVVYLPEAADGAERLGQWLQGKDLGRPELKKRQVSVYLPQFKAETSYSLKPVLIDLGMKAAFDDADFTGMSPKGRDLYISHVLHKAFVEVNEEGTEAAAATAVVLKERVAERVTVFRADRPFVFTIRDNKSGTVLFLGRYSGPTA